MDTVDIWKRVLIGAIVAVLVVVVIGGAYFMYAWFKVGSNSGPEDTSLTPTEQQQRHLDSFTAPPPTGTSAQDAEGSASVPETPSEFDAPAQRTEAQAQTQTDAPATPSSFDAPM